MAEVQEARVAGDGRSARRSGGYFCRHSGELLAKNMSSVGVDISRLGLMIVEFVKSEGRGALGERCAIAKIGLITAWFVFAAVSPALGAKKLWADLRPLDTQIRVALEFADNLAAKDPSFLLVYRVGPSELAPSGDQGAVAMPKDMVSEEEISGLPKAPSPLTLQISEAFLSYMPEAIKTLFPNCVVSAHDKPAENGELLLKADITFDYLGDFEGFPKSARGLEVNIQLTVVDPEGKVIATLNGKGSRVLRKSTWSLPSDLWKEVAGNALYDSERNLISKLKNSEPLKLFLKERSESRARPGGLVATASFDDRAAYFNNGYLDAGEEARLKVVASNQGPGPSFGVVVLANSDRPDVEVTGNGMIGDLKPGQSKEVEMHLRGSAQLGEEPIRLRIETNEKRGYGARPVLLEIATRPLIAPELEIVDIALSDHGGRAIGDGDGRPATGETLEAIVRVRNRGAGDAVGVSVTVASMKSASTELLEPKATIPRIAAGSSEEVRLLLRIPFSPEAPDLSLRFDLADARGPQVSSATKEQIWTIQPKKPDLELAARLFDGNSPGSRGNRDGHANNFERIEVAVTATNRGDLPARGVKIAVESADSALVPRPATFEIGDLPPRTEAPPQRFAFDVPRTFGRDRAIEDLRFALNITQQDFPPQREPIALAFRALRPELILDAEIPPTLARGSGGELVLRFRNTGDLDAEAVAVEVLSDLEGVDLLNERSVPSRTYKQSLGNLSAQAGITEARVPLNLRRSAALGAAPLRVRVTQKDFPPVEQSFSLTVEEEPATVVEAAPRVEASPPPAPSLRAPPAAATISFVSNTPGQHLLQEAVGFRFEIQSSSELAEVRATRNDCALPLEGANRTTSGESGVLAVQYELPVLLDPGENRFEVVAVTREGLRTARSLTLYRDHEVGRLWVVAIGVGKFAEPSISGLAYPEDDARDVLNYFRDAFQLPAEQLFLRVDEQASLREIKSTLGTHLMKRATDPRDTVIIYFAGHGMRDRIAGSLDPDGLAKYFLPYDASLADLYSTALDMDEVANILRRLIPERVVVLVDSCFSGAAGGRSPYDPRSSSERAPISGEFLDRMAHIGKGRVVLAASGPNESAQEDADLGHGVFTYYLLQGLHGAADGDGDGEIDVHEIYRYLSERVSKATHGKQNPQLKEPDLVGQILLGRGAVRRPK